MEILIATGNASKVREFREMLGDVNARWRMLSEFSGIGEVEETGKTFRANAILKASEYAKATKRWALADDSGLEVDALGGKPGVHSARWAKIHDAGSGDAANNALLLKQLESTPEKARTARFVCVLALANPWGQVVLTCRDTVEGRITFSAAGENGFGYDPLFHIDGLGRTTAQLSSEEKHRISHRGKALMQMRKMMERVGLGAPRRGDL